MTEPEQPIWTTEEAEILLIDAILSATYQTGDDDDLDNIRNHSAVAKAFARHRLAAYEAGRLAVLEEAAVIADEWAAENELAASKARKNMPSAIDPLEAAASECEAIAAAIRARKEKQV